MRFALSIFFCTCINVCVSQTYSSIIQDDRIYSFINEVINSDSMRFSNTVNGKLSIFPETYNIWNDSDFVFTDTRLQPFTDLMFLFSSSTDTILNEEDRKYMHLQFTSLKGNNWKKPFDNSRLEKNKQKSPSRYFLAVPLFSKNLDCAIFPFCYYCGDECASGGFYYYKLTSVGWRFITARRFWMS